jgi:hypothetical protein
MYFHTGYVLRSRCFMLAGLNENFYHNSGQSPPCTTRSFIISPPTVANFSSHSFAPIAPQPAHSIAKGLEREVIFRKNDAGLLCTQDITTTPELVQVDLRTATSSTIATSDKPALFLLYRNDPKFNVHCSAVDKVLGGDTDGESVVTCGSVTKKLAAVRRQGYAFVGLPSPRVQIEAKTGLITLLVDNTDLYLLPSRNTLIVVAGNERSLPLQISHDHGNFYSDDRDALSFIVYNRIVAMVEASSQTLKTIDSQFEKADQSINQVDFDLNSIKCSRKRQREANDLLVKGIRQLADMQSVLIKLKEVVRQQKVLTHRLTKEDAPLGAARFFATTEFRSDVRSRTINATENGHAEAIDNYLAKIQAALNQAYGVQRTIRGYGETEADALERVSGRLREAFSYSFALGGLGLAAMQVVSSVDAWKSYLLGIGLVSVVSAATPIAIGLVRRHNSYKRLRAEGVIAEP